MTLGIGIEKLKIKAYIKLIKIIEHNGMEIRKTIQND